MEMNGMSLNSIKSRTKTVIKTSDVKARRFGTLAAVAGQEGIVLWDVD